MNAKQRVALLAALGGSRGDVERRRQPSRDQPPGFRAAKVSRRSVTTLVVGTTFLLPTAAAADERPKEKPRICQSAEERRQSPKVMEASDLELVTFSGLLEAGVAMEAGELLEVVESERTMTLRLTALLALGYCDLRQTRERLEALLDIEPPGFFRETLVKTLMRWKSSKARTIVARILENPATGSAARLDWCPDFIRSGGDCDLAFLRSMATSPDEGFRRRAVAVEASLLERPESSELATALLRDHLRDPSKSVRRAALNAIVTVALDEPRSDVCDLVSEAKLLVVDPDEKERVEMWMENFHRTGRRVVPPVAR